MWFLFGRIALHLVHTNTRDWFVMCELNTRRKSSNESLAINLRITERRIIFFFLFTCNIEIVMFDSIYTLTSHLQYLFFEIQDQFSVCVRGVQLNTPTNISVKWIELWKFYITKIFSELFWQLLVKSQHHRQYSFHWIYQDAKFSGYDEIVSLNECVDQFGFSLLEGTMFMRFILFSLRV